ncbi:GGDEF domain-containing protein [Serpentinicella alkaliphila]|nr:GGDEF domain-containing protein [Serpentinicella alkaliphila]
MSGFRIFVLYGYYYDQLTGHYNRYFFQEKLKRLDVERNLPISIVMVDVNELKLTNDAFGNEVGDMLLKSISEQLKLGCTNDDIIARVGGDEFVILLPKTSYTDTERIVNRIYKAIEQQKINQVVVSISMGC